MRAIRVETSLKQVPKSLWTKDSKTDQCSVCDHLIVSGWVCSNKHHCRYCGQIVCSLCSTHAVFESRSSYHRICDSCYQNAVKRVAKANKPKAQKQIKSKERHSTQSCTPLGSPPTPEGSQDEETLPTIPSPAPKHRSRANQRKKRGNLSIDYRVSPGSPSSAPIQSFWVNRRDRLVQGFVRSLRAESKGYSNLLIPHCMIALLTKWCFLNDQWKCSPHLKVTHNGQTLSRAADNNQHCYYSFGSHPANPQRPVKQWMIRLDDIEYYTNNHCSLLVGVAQTNKLGWIQNLLGDFTYGAFKGYALRVATSSRFAHQHAKQAIFIEKSTLQKGDVIKLDIDLRGQGRSGRLSYRFQDACGKPIDYGLNARHQWLGLSKGVAFSDLDCSQSYSLVVGMYCKNKVTFLESRNVFAL